MKCSYCNKEIENWANNNVDSEGNKYCMECVAKIQLIAEQEGYDD